MNNSLKTQTPFVKKFKAGNRLCIYDVNTNELLNVNPVVFDIIDDIHELKADGILEKFKHNHPIPAIKENLDLIYRMMNQRDYFTAKRPTITSGYKKEKDIRDLLRTGLKQIVLELTEQCNLRCKYCTFSGKYRYARTHGNNNMKFEVAKKALDFFLAYVDKGSEKTPAAITYYGGEPLVNFDLLKQTVEYALENYKNHNTRFSFTTNGTLLGRKEIIDFLVQHDIHISISLDGPQDIHDRYRRFRNNKPTFETIFNNLIHLKKRFPGYFAKRISIIGVLTPPLDMKRISDFFFKNDLFKELEERFTFSIVDTNDSTLIQDLCLEDEFKKIKEVMDSMLNRYKAALISGTYHELDIEKGFLLRRFHSIATRRLCNLGDRIAPLGACIPGKRKLFVDRNGNFYMCEKVLNNYKIGDVENGFDYGKIFAFFKEYDRFFDDCSECWALRLCNKCFNTVRKGEIPEHKRKEEFCNSMRHTLERDLALFCEIIEKNPDAFHVYENITIT